MQSQTAVVIGATGLTGSHVVEVLLNDAAFHKIRVLVRKTFAVTHPKLEVQIVDFNNVNDVKVKMGKGDCMFCCVGTTQRNVKGDKDAYRKVDYDIPVNTARLASEAGFKKYLLVSAVGANAKSSAFYLKLKGEVEQAVSSFPFESIHIFQPSMLLGKRREFRLGELIGKTIIIPFSFLMFGSLSKYKAIQARDVAEAMVAAVKLNVRSVNVYMYKEILGLIKGL
jgi:uncharacterized protein YbjT (DUF2867 family)